MKPAVLLSITTCLVGVGVGVLGERFVLSRKDKQLDILREVRATRAVLADLQRSNSECAPTSLLTTVARDSSSASGTGTMVQPGAAAQPVARQPDARPTTETEATPTAPENFAAFEAGEELIDSAIARGAWTRNDRRELLRLSAGLSSEQFSALQLRIAQAVNQDQLVPELP